MYFFFFFFHYVFGENSDVDFLSTTVNCGVSSPHNRIWTGNHLNTNNLFLAWVNPKYKNINLWLMHPIGNKWKMWLMSSKWQVADASVVCNNKIQWTGKIGLTPFAQEHDWKCKLFSRRQLYYTATCLSRVSLCSYLEYVN